MPDTATLTALLARVRATTGPDRALDVEIVQALFPDIGPYRPMCVGDEAIFWNEPFRKMECPALTASIDAAVALVDRMLPGAQWRLLCVLVDKEMGDTHPFHARILPSKRFHQAPTAALAILAATLIALGAKETTDE